MTREQKITFAIVVLTVMAYGAVLGAAIHQWWTDDPTQLDRIEASLDQTVDFLSDIHAERSACK